MGPNGSGKSTLANAIMGHPALEVTEGTITFKGEDMTEADPDERSRAGLFMAFQYPVAIPGVSVSKYLRMIVNAQREARGEDPIKIKDFAKLAKEAMELANIPQDFSSRYLNDGFSGGEKKRMELLQLALLRPEIAVLDETDSGLDIDALRVVAEGVNQFAGPEMGVLIITHYQRILHMVKPDFVHVMYEGRIVKAGRPGAGRDSSRRRATAGSARRWRQEPPPSGRTWSRRPPSAPPPVPDREGPRRLPGAGARGPRQAGRLPRQRRQRPAGAGLDPGGRPLRAGAPLQRPPRLAHALGRGDRGLRGGAGDGRRPPRRRRPARGRLRPQRDRGDQPRRPRLGRRQPRRGRPDRAHRDGAPLQHRPLAAARRAGPGRRSTGCRSSDDGLLDLDAYAALLERGPKLVAVDPRLQRARQREPAGRDRPAGARGRRPGARRRRPGGAEDCRSTSPSSASTSTP